MNNSFDRDNFNRDISKSIKKELVEKGMRLNELAEKAGISRTYLSNLINCHKDWSIKTLKKIKVALPDVEIDLNNFFYN